MLLLCPRLHNAIAETLHRGLSVEKQESCPDRESPGIDTIIASCYNRPQVSELGDELTAGVSGTIAYKFMAENIGWMNTFSRSPAPLTLRHR